MGSLICYTKASSPILKPAVTSIHNTNKCGYKYTSVCICISTKDGRE